MIKSAKYLDSQSISGGTPVTFLRALPLLLTCLRLALVPTYIAGRNLDWPQAAILAIVGLAILTDWLDGFLARRLNSVSNLGKLLDPFADAVFCMSVFVDFAMRGEAPWWVVGLLVAREAAVTFVARPLALRHKLVIAASWTGKIKTVTQFVAIVSLVLAGPSGFIRTVANVSLYAALVLSLVSAAQYGLRVRRHFRSGADASKI